MTYHNPGTGFRRRENEAEAEKQDARIAQNRARYVPMSARDTATWAPEDETLYVRSEFTARTSDHWRAYVCAYRYRHGIAVTGKGSVEQLVEMRDALNAEIRKARKEADHAED